MRGSIHAPNCNYYPCPRGSPHNSQRNGTQNQQPSSRNSNPKGLTTQNTNQPFCKQKPFPVVPKPPKLISHTPLSAFSQSLLSPYLPPNFPFFHPQNKSNSFKISPNLIFFLCSPKFLPPFPVHGLSPTAMLLHTFATQLPIPLPKIPF